VVRLRSLVATIVAANLNVSGTDLSSRADHTRDRAVFSPVKTGLDVLVSEGFARLSGKKIGLLTNHTGIDRLRRRNIDLLAAAADLFDGLGPYARATQEVSSIAKDAGMLIGRATDPVAGGLSMDAILGEGYFGRTRREVLMLGAGGSAVALTLHMMQKSRPDDRPRQIVVVNRSAPRLARLQEMVHRTSGEGEMDIRFQFIQNNDAERNDEILAGLPPGSVVVNATGMGKDTPGSPLTDKALFPVGGVAWELNYRGELDFMRQAEAQAGARGLTVADGWEYFVHGWSQVISHVLHVEIDAAMFARLSDLAAAVR